jgi:N,N'-diacetyllegionaminate synthase
MNKPYAFSIGNRLVGDGQPAFIIAEAGVNHNGDVEIAKELIRQAKRTGADCVKFQTFAAQRVITKSAPKAEYQLKTTNPAESQFEMLKKLELAEEHYLELLELCAQEDIIFMSTPYNPEDVDFLVKLGTPAFKLASIHLAEPSFIAYVAQTGKPLILSTGMATMAEIDEAVRTIRATGNEQFVVLQCTTNYPSDLQDANLRVIPTLKNAFGCLTGYSDHTQTDSACIASIALGACVIEKHFTLDTAMPGPDHSSSFDPPQFAKLVSAIREVEQALGSPYKHPTPVEVRNAQGMRRSIVAKRAIQQGQTLTAEMLTFKRPASGLRPALLPEILGKTAACDIQEDELLRWEMLKG